MSLLDSYSRECVLMEKNRTLSPEGGWKTEWREGLIFQNHQVLDTSMEARRAEKDGVTSVYSALVEKGFPIEYNDYFMDKITGYTYRVSSNPDEKQSPDSASFSLKYFTAERKALPT